MSAGALRQMRAALRYAAAADRAAIRAMIAELSDAPAVLGNDESHDEEDFGDWPEFDWLPFGRQREIVTAAQEPAPVPLQAREQHWPAADVEASPVKRASEKVKARARRTAQPGVPAARAVVQPGADGSLAPRVFPQGVAKPQADRPRVASAPPAPLPARITAMAPRVDARRAAEEAAIAEFAARKGVSRVMSPEQVALFLREAGEDAVVREAEAPTKRGADNYARVWRRRYLLAGKEVKIAEFYRAANTLRVKAGLPQVVVPEDLQVSA